MNNHLHLRLIETTSNPRASSAAGWKALGREVTGDEQDIEDMLADPVRDLVADMDRLIARQGPLSPELAVQATRKVIEAVLAARAACRYAVGSTHVIWLGCVFYFALTGKAALAPRPGQSLASQPPPVSKFSPYPIRQEIEEIVSRSLSANRQGRFASVVDLESALAALPEAHEAPRSVQQAPPAASGDAYDSFESEPPTLPPVSGVCLTRAASAALPEKRRTSRIAS